MSDKNPIQTTTNIIAKAALITDLDSSLMKKDVYSHARNLDRNTHEGNIGTDGNNPANSLCVTLTHPFIGSISLNDGRFAIFSGNKLISEVGILNEETCEYQKIISSKCLNFDPCSPITGVARKNDQDHIILYFRDDINPIRRINLNRIPYTYTLGDDKCETKEYTTELDCDEIMLFPKITIPCITLDESPSGNLPNGTYSVAIAYNIDNQIYSDYYGLTNRIQLYSKSGGNGFTISITDLDRDFANYDVVVIQDIEGAKTTFRLGSFSTSQRMITVDDLNNIGTIDPSDLVIQRKTWERAGIISANSNYLIFADLTKKRDLNYQLQAMNIEIEYTVEQVAEDYYEKSPKDVGYYRDENYEFFIQWVDDKGVFSYKYHIPGPKKTAEHSVMASGADVYELDDRYYVQDPNKPVERWEVENTAGAPTPLNNQFVNGRRLLAYGDMGYSESTEQYPDNADLYGEYACTNIRFPRFPDECKVPRYSKIGGKTYINILGVRFKNIEAPKDENGNLIPNIVGYRILRSDRSGGNKTVIARGLASNMRYYQDQQINQQVWYANYPYNDLSPDQYLSSTQTVFKNNKETKFTPLTGVFTDKFAFYTPHAYFPPTYKLGTEFKFETEEIANVEGYFEEVNGHPKHALLTQLAFWISVSLGTIEAILIQEGKKCVMREKKKRQRKRISGMQGEDTVRLTEGDVNAVNASETTTQEYYCIDSAEDFVGLDPIAMIKSAISSRDKDLRGTLQMIKRVIQAVAVAGIKVASFGFYSLQYANNILDIIKGFTSEVQYAYQYNSSGTFDRQKCISRGHKRRITIDKPERISSNLHTIDGLTLNNFGKQDFMLVRVNKEVKVPSTTDDTRRTISGFGTCDDPSQKVNSTASLFYATSKIKNVNQYGQPGSSPTVLVSSCITKIIIDPEDPTHLFESPHFYGGDCIITKFAIQIKQPFFRQNLATTFGNELPTNYPDGIGYNYRLYRNIGYARYWIDSHPYDLSQLLSKNVVNKSKFTRTTTSHHNLDCKFKDGDNVFRVDNSRFFLSYNGVLEFYVESDYNIAFREETQRPHFSRKSRNLSEIFKEQRLWFPEEFKINPAYTRFQTKEVFALQIPETFRNIDNVDMRWENAVIYSLPSFNSQTVDNWRYFLPNNFFTFNKGDYGHLTAIHKISQDRLIYLFDRSSPFISPGRDEIQTIDGRKVQVGDSGLFARDPREIIPTDVNYGSCQSKYAFSANQFGYFYPSSYHGRYFNFTESLNDITRAGMYYWHRRYMPIQLYKEFPNYPKEENPLCGVGYLSSFDSTNEIVYLSKRDFIPKKEFKDHIEYNSEKNRFEFKGIPIDLRSDYFEDISWTLAYDPTEKAFLSWYDWHPDWTIQTERYFMTVKKNSIWKHNERCDLFCNYYGKDYPFEVEIVDTDGQIINIRKNVEYQLEAYRYKNQCRDKFHILNENFDHMIVHNTEQSSPLLKLVPNPQTRYGANEYPRKNGNKWDVLFSKEENKYRVNQFWDSVKDRGEFSNREFHIWVNHPSGYKRSFNPEAIDINKEESQRKKFRHYYTKFWFAKEVCNDVKYIVKLFNIKKNISGR